MRHPLRQLALHPLRHLALHPPRHLVLHRKWPHLARRPSPALRRKWQRRRSRHSGLPALPLARRPTSPRDRRGRPRERSRLPSKSSGQPPVPANAEVRRGRRCVPGCATIWRARGRSRQDPSARIGRNPNQGNQAFQLAGRGGNPAIAGRALRNPAFADRPNRAGPAGRALARATFQGSFAARHAGRFADRGRDRDWRRHHRYIPALVIGWAGPLFWPYAYDDFVSYTFYPYAYDTFWPSAYDDVYASMFGPYAPGPGPAPMRQSDDRRAQAAHVLPAARTVGADLCSGQTAGLTDWPIERIAQTIQPDDAQRAALDELKDATAKALDILKASCPTELPSTPTGRIAAMHDAARGHAASGAHGATRA